MNEFVTSHTEPRPGPVERLDEARYAAALAEAQRALDPAQPPPLDGVIHGVGVRLHSNHPHWRRYWSANWFASQQWATLTGTLPPTEPRVHVFAPRTPASTAPWSGYSHDHHTAILTGDSPYGHLRALALAAVAVVLAEEEAVHFLPGLCLKQAGRGTLILTPPGLELATALPPLMQDGAAHLLALDGVFVRYGLVRMVDGVTLLPTRILDEKGVTIPGDRLFPWLEEYGHLEPRADARCLTLRGAEQYCFARDLDLWRAPEALAFPLEQAWYIPTSLVAAQPSLAALLCRATQGEPNDACEALENVPPLTSAAWERYGNWATQTAAMLVQEPAPPTRTLLAELGVRKVAEALCRLRAAPHGRAMVAPELLWPGRAGGHPWRPLLIERVALMDGGQRQLNASELATHLTGPSAVRDWLGNPASVAMLVELLGRATAA